MVLLLYAIREFMILCSREIMLSASQQATVAVLQQPVRTHLPVRTDQTLLSDCISSRILVPLTSFRKRLYKCPTVVFLSAPLQHISQQIGAGRFSEQMQMEIRRNYSARIL